MQLQGAAAIRGLRGQWAPDEESSTRCLLDLRQNSILAMYFEIIQNDSIPNAGCFFLEHPVRFSVLSVERERSTRKLASRVFQPHLGKVSGVSGWFSFACFSIIS